MEGWDPPKVIEVVRKIADEPVTQPSDVDPSMPDDLDEILLTALAKEKRDRYEDVLYLRDDLRSLFDEL